MTYQAVRGVYEQAVIDALAPLQVFVANQSMEDLDAATEFGYVRINFGLTTEQNIGCAAAENLRGSLICEVYTRKGVGPGRGLQLITPVIRDLVLLNKTISTEGQQIIARIGAVRGPEQSAPEGRPHYVTRFSCPIRAKYVGV